MFKDISIRNGFKAFAIAVVLLFSALGIVAYLALNSFGNTFEAAVAEAGHLRYSSRLQLAHEALRTDIQASGNAEVRQDPVQVDGIRKRLARHLESLDAAIENFQPANLPARIKS